MTNPLTYCSREELNKTLLGLIAAKRTLGLTAITGYDITKQLRTKFVITSRVLDVGSYLKSFNIEEALGIKKISSGTYELIK